MKMKLVKAFSVMSSVVRVIAVAGLAAVSLLVGIGVDRAAAHGERNQEPFLRMRTAHWYDVKFSLPENSKIKVNDTLTITGKFRLFGAWPTQIPNPESIYMNVNTAGPVFTKKESWVNGKSSIQSFSGVLGRDYEFKVVLQARWAGNWHVHPMVNVKDGGGLIGPGVWYNVDGSYGEFVLPAETIDGVKIANLETWGLERVFGWHALWMAIGIAYLLWWIRRPVLIPRYLMVKNGNFEHTLVTRADKVLGGFLLVGTIALVAGSAIYISNVYPRTIPLQGGRALINPLPEPPTIKVDMKEGEYFVPGRTLAATIAVTNTADAPIRLGEFSSANLRFIDNSVAGTEIPAGDNFPSDLIAKKGLQVSDSSPIAPGETRTIRIETSDVAWEVERLTSLMKDPDNSIGALLFFYDDTGKRYISEMVGAVVPSFKGS